MLFNACSLVAGGPEPQEGGGLDQAQTSWSKGASGTIAPMKRRRAWRGLATKEQFCFVLVDCIYLPYLAS